MKTSIKISEQEVKMLQSMIGKTFEKFKCDSFIYSPMVYGIIGFYIDGKVYKFSTFLDSVQYFFEKDDVARIKIDESKECEIVSKSDDFQFIETPISSKISTITIVNDFQKVVHEKESRCFERTVGIIFHFEDSLELAFEVSSWFSELITVKKGYNLLKTFVSESEFLEEWNGCMGYSASAKREIIVIEKQ